MQPGNDTIEVEEGDSVDICYFPTVPFFCSKWITSQSHCENEVEIAIPENQENKQCENGRADLILTGRADLILTSKRSCGFKMKGILHNETWEDRWNEIKSTCLKLNVQASLSPAYDDDLSMSIKAKVPTVLSHGVWSQTLVPEVQVSNRL